MHIVTCSWKAKPCNSQFVWAFSHEPRQRNPEFLLQNPAIPRVRSGVWFMIGLRLLCLSCWHHRQKTKGTQSQKSMKKSWAKLCCITAGNIQTSTSDILKQAPWRLWSHLKTLMIGSCPRDSELSCLKPHQLTSSHLDITVYNQSYEDRYIQVISWPTGKIRPCVFGVPKMDLLLERWKKKQGVGWWRAKYSENIS